MFGFFLVFGEGFCIYEEAEYQGSKSTGIQFRHCNKKAPSYNLKTESWSL